MRHASPNFNDRPTGEISALVLHYTGMPTAEAALQRLCDPACNVSAHYMVDEDGTVHALVPEEKRAWHAGASQWRGRDNVNDFSIGIEIVNPGHEFGYRPFPKMQMEAVAGLCKEIVARHGIAPRNVVAHSDIAPGRKDDPGELFDWRWLAAQGVGLWPDPLPVANGPLPEIKDVQRKLKDYGYPIEESGILDDATGKVIVAFQRHFRPATLAERWDGECDALLAALLKMV